MVTRGFRDGLAVVLLTLLTLSARANDLVISNVEADDPESNQIKILFDISWQNSWRHALNHDAAWVFIKYSTDNGGTWNHATIKDGGFSHGAGTPLDIIVAPDGKGVFLRRDTDGEGETATADVGLVWDWLADGLKGPEDVKVRVFGIEMVYVPAGAFWAGSGGSGTDEFALTQIVTPNASISGGYPGVQVAPNASWPNGFSAFYAMKYEISQGQYRDFLNTLTPEQAANRCSPADIGLFMSDSPDSEIPQNRNGIQKRADGYACNLHNELGSPPFDNGGEAIACNWLSWADLAAYLDWSALRPMTELEYEKLCRGPSEPVADEYPWGAAHGLSEAPGIENPGTAEETFTGDVVYANCAADNQAGVQGPMRVGAFGCSERQTTRMHAGAGFYGNMGLAGNLWERCITIGNSTGRAYTGEHGDGTLTAEGNANTGDWPGTDAIGTGARGGSWQSAAARLRTSDRANASDADANRRSTRGGRGVRTAP